MLFPRRTTPPKIFPLGYEHEVCAKALLDYYDNEPTCLGVEAPNKVGENRVINLSEVLGETPAITDGSAESMVSALKPYRTLVDNCTPCVFALVVFMLIMISAKKFRSFQQPMQEL